MKAFERLLPIAKLLEMVSPLPGLSVLAVGERGGTPNSKSETRDSK